MALGVASVEQLDRLVQRRAVDEGVVGRRRHTQHVGVLVLARTGEIRVDLAEAERQRLLDGATSGVRRCVDPGKGRQALFGRWGDDTGTRCARRCRQVERLEDEWRYLARPGAAIVGRVRQDQLVTGPGHRHVAEAPFLRERPIRRRGLAVAQAGGQGECLAPAVAREPPRDESGQVDDRELEALGLVHREHRDGVGVRIEIGGGRIVAGVEQGLQMACHEQGAIVGEESRLRSDDVEEPGDVAEAFLGRGRLRRGQPGERAAVTEERVQHLAGRALVGHRREPGHVGDEPMHALARPRGHAQDAGLAVELVERGHHRAVSAAGRVDDGGQVVAAEAVHLRGGERVQVDARLGICHGSQEGHQEAHLRPGVQSGRAGEPPRDTGDVERPQHRVGMAVGAHEHGVIPGSGTLGDPPHDVRGDPVRLLRPGGERLEADR